MGGRLRNRAQGTHGFSGGATVQLGGPVLSESGRPSVVLLEVTE
jgi:hypothetical protein